MAKASRAKTTMSGGSKKKGKKGKKAHKMSIRRSANGGYIAEHSYQPEENGVAPEPEEHTVPDIEALKEHVGEHMGPEEEPQAQPQAAPTPPMAG